MKAISHGKSSLLAGGISRHEGVFEGGEVVRLLSATGHEIGRGVCRISSSEVALWTRQKTTGERPLDSWPLAVHRNTMVLWEREEE
jgi:glutamate 5-kinase